MEIDLIAGRMAAIGHASRLSVYRLLVRAGLDGMKVGDIAEALNLPGSTLNHHLSKLIAVGLAEQERQGTTLICRADFRAMVETFGFLAQECCADSNCCSDWQDAVLPALIATS